MARIGSVAAAPFVGDEFASLYLGTERVPTVPGRPAWDGTPAASGGVALAADFLPPDNDGGSAITGYNVYVNGEFDDALGAVATDVEFAISPGATYELAIAAVNAVGVGPLLKTVYEYVED